MFLLNRRPIYTKCIVSFCTAASIVINFFLLIFVYFCSSNFLLRVSSHWIQPLCTPGHVWPYSYVQTMHVSLRLLYYLCWQLYCVSVGHKTGTHRDQVKNTRLPPHNSELFRCFGTLILPRPDPSRTWAIQTEHDTSNYLISRRQVYLWVIVSQKKRADQRVYDMSLTNQ